MAETSAETAIDAGGVLEAARDALERAVREQPYPVLAAGLLAGYVAGGGLFSPLTRLLARAAMGAFLVPGFREHLRGMADELREVVGSTGA